MAARGIIKHAEAKRSRRCIGRVEEKWAGGVAGSFLLPRCRRWYPVASIPTKPRHQRTQRTVRMRIWESVLGGGFPVSGLEGRVTAVLFSGKFSQQVS